MSKSAAIKTSAILASLFILTVTAYPALAQDQPVRSAATNKNLLIKQKIETKKENIENRIVTMQEKLASREAALKVKLQSFRDQAKATAAARINTNLNRINQIQTEQMKKHLSLMSSILDKLAVRVNKPTPEIKDPASVKAAIASAREVIATASAAVTAQAEKDYTIQVTSESRIRIDAKTQRDQLHTDILTTRKAVIDAKQAVANAIRIAKEGTTSGQQ